jgi:hypothetical protein
MKGIRTGQVMGAETRAAFRIAAGVVAGLLLLVSLPIAIAGALNSHAWEYWFAAVCSLFAGVGMAVSARTGQWPFVWRGRRRND